MDKTDNLTGWDETEKDDKNLNGIDDELEPPNPDIALGAEKLAERFSNNPNADPYLSGGDVDAQWEMAESTGDETATGSMATPGQNVIDDIGRGMGITYAADEELKVGQKERSRDKHRWELDPASAEDYKDRVRDEK